MFLKTLTAASNNHLHLKTQLGERHPSLIEHPPERRPSLVTPNRKCHREMFELQEHLGRAGTITKEIEQLMGLPTKVLDQPDEMLLYELKRNNETYEYPTNAKIWIYQWRDNRDYVYFIISRENKVIQSAWYYALE